VSGGLEGIPGGSPVELLPVGQRLWLATCNVPLDVYGPGPLENRLRDIDWVGQIAIAHERVVEHFAALPGVTVVPMKLFTMFSSPERATADITARAASIRATVKRIQGSEEWGVRIVRSPSVTAPAGAATDAKPVSGAAFLAAKKQKRDDARDARVAAAEAALDAYDALSKLAKGAVRREDPPPAGATPPLLDAAFLVPFDRRDAFGDAAKRQADDCAKAGAQLTLSGPWPAYSFIQPADTR
jgi:hypothetical protein